MELSKPISNDVLTFFPLKVVKTIWLFLEGAVFTDSVILLQFAISESLGLTP